MNKLKLILATISFVCISGIATAQTITYSELSSGKELSGKYQKYESKSGKTYAIGDKVQLGVPSGSNGMFVNIQKMDITAKPAEFGKEDSNKYIILQAIKTLSNESGDNQVGFLAQAENTKDYYIVFIENAIATNEIK